ncbi:hypothetical protein TY91_07635 [Secundilactobacillus collinoides]|uniref:Uncharacterized protein n=1 Tax=Secundilactobacillus collinoides TaxID=33960 RepID=A0A166H0P3_SECCO|nr:hypothetical protein TY91_07635 [Secundilactobacillus collinoides]
MKASVIHSCTGAVNVHFEHQVHKQPFCKPVFEKTIIDSTGCMIFRILNAIADAIKMRENVLDTAESDTVR